MAKGLRCGVFGNETKKLEDKIQERTTEYTKKIDAILEAKEAEVMTI